MHLLVTKGAVLETRAPQIMDCRPHRSQCRVGSGSGHGQVGMALHAHEAHFMPDQHPRIRRPMRLVAGTASFEAHGSVLERKRSHFIAVAFAAIWFVESRGLNWPETLFAFPFEFLYAFQLEFLPEFLLEFLDGRRHGRDLRGHVGAPL